MKHPQYLPKKDPFTGETFIPHRSNQKFAKPENKMAYNNSKAKQRSKELKPFLDIINCNAKILSRVLGSENQVIVTKEFLRGAGFQFEYFTGTIWYNRSYYNRIYNFGFFAAAKENFIISRII